MLCCGRRKLRVAVVLAEEDDRESPNRRKVHGLVERTLCNCSVSEEGNGHPIVCSELGGSGGADCDRKPSSDDPVGAKDADIGVGDVHRSPTPVVRAVCFAHQLGEHPDGFETLCQTVAVATVVRGDDVGTTKRPAGANCRRLLTNRQVYESGYLTISIHRRHALFEATNLQHPAVHLQKVFGIKGGRSGLAVVHRTTTVTIGTRFGETRARSDRYPGFFSERR